MAERQGPHWRIFDLLVALSDFIVMPGLFLPAGYFACPSLRARGSMGLFPAKCRRLGISLPLAGMLLVPLIHYVKVLRYAPAPPAYWTSGSFR